MIKRCDFSAVIFDLDGLVLDTERTYRIAWKQAGKAMGHDFPEAFLVEMTGLPSKEVLNKIKSYCGPNFGIDEFNRLSAYHWRQYVSVFGIDVKPGFHDLLEFLADWQIPYGLASNSHSTNANENLRLAGLEGVFAVQSTREQVPHGKPAPDLFLNAAAQLNAPIRNCLVLEDSAIGIEAAIRAGAMPALIASGPMPDRPVVHSGCCRYDDLTELLRELQGYSA